jgi:hypothetical protein
MTDYSKFKVATAFQDIDPAMGLADEGITVGFPTIRYRGKAWTLQYGGKNYPFKRADDGTPLSYIDVVIVGVAKGVSKVYFGQREWTEDSTDGPICTSLHGDVPDPGVPIPQSPSCGTCSHNEFIVKPNGNKAKECQDHKRLAVLLMPTMTQKMFPQPLIEPVHLKIPPGSLKAWLLYRNELAAASIPFAAVVTRVAFAADRTFQMTFDIEAALNNDDAKAVRPLMEDTQTRAIIGGTPSIARIAPPPASKKPERVDTGLQAAFGKAVEKPKAENISRGGRPPGSRNKPKPVEVNEISEYPAGAGKLTPDKAAAGNGSDASEFTEMSASASYEESDTDIDESINKLLGDKANKMMK